MAGNDTSDMVLSSITSIVSKIGLVLSRTKDTLLKDLLGDMENYFPDKSEEELKNLSETIPAFKDFIEHLFTRLGYDISNFEKNEELYELIKSLISTSVAIGEGAKSLFSREEKDWIEKAEEARRKIEEGEGKDWSIGSEDKEGVYASISVGDNDFIKLIDSIIEIIKLIKKFKDFEWKNLQGEYKEFFNYMEDTYFTKKFAERLFDHIIVVVLQHAKEVFADDINLIVDTLKETEYDTIKKLQTEIGKIEAAISGMKGEINGTLQELEIQLKIAKAALEKEASNIFGDFNALGKNLSKVYAVLDFLQVISKETIEIAKYIPNTGVDKVDGFFNNTLPPIEINVIHWSRIEQLFSNPLDYFKEKYPIDNYDDAEELMKKLITVAQAFSANVPDFSSMKQLLMELLIRIKDKIAKEANTFTNDVSEAFEKCRDFIIDLLKILESIAVEVHDKFKDSFKDFSISGNTIFNSLSSNFENIRKGFGEIAQSINASNAEAIIQKISLPNTSIRFVTIGDGKQNNTININDILSKSFQKAIKEKAKQYDLFKDVTEADWKKIVSAEAGKNIADKYKDVLGKIEGDLVQIFNQTYWETKFKEVVKKLEDEFKKQTNDIPTSKGDLVSLATKWAKGEGSVKNPFSAFDFNAYFSIIKDEIKTLIPSPENYYKDLKEATFNSISELKSNIPALTKISDAEFKKQLYAFINDFFVECWKELKNSLLKPIIYPFVQMIEHEVKQWAKDILDEILKTVKTTINSLNIDVNNYSKVFSDNYEKVEKLLKLTLTTAQDGINSWQDGLSFAIDLYQAIPTDVKKHLSELVNFDLPSVTLPDYKLDVKNKFLAVTLYEYPGDKENSGYYGEKGYVDGRFSFQLVAFVGEKEFKVEGKEEKEKKAGVYFLPVINGELNSAFNIGAKHVLELFADISGNDGGSSATAEDEEMVAIGLFISKSNITILDDKEAFATSLELKFSRGQYVNNNPKPEKVDKISVLNTKYVDLTIDNYPQTLRIGYGDYDKRDKTKAHGLKFEYIGEIENARFTLKLRETNDFFKEILSKDIEFNVEELILGYSLAQGFTFNSKMSLCIELYYKKKLGNVTFRNIGLNFSSGNFHNILSSVTTSFSVDFKGIVFSLSDIGFGVDFNYMKPDGGIGDFDFGGKFVWPSGIGIAIDTGGVKGSGVLKYNDKKEELLGALELDILDLVGVSALVILNMQMPDGSKGFSFMGAVSAFFTPGIPLGMGFSMTAIGGSLGLNRKLDTEKLQTAVRAGTLGSYMFVKDLDKNLDAVITNVASFYPICKDQYFFGFLTQITYAEIFNIDLGLFIQAPNPVSIVIVGGLHFKVTDKCEKLLSLNAYFAGGIDFSKGLWFDASLVDTYIVGIEFYGDLALRMYWKGKTKGFLLSVGGFHPEFTPDPGFNVGSMKRLGMKLDYEILKISLDCYFAVTSNSVQFGADFQLQIGWDKFGIFGYMGFDVLFMFNPFKFMFDVRAGLALKLGSVTLFSISLSLGLSGPARWNAKGKAGFWFLFIKIEVGFDLSWGKEQSAGKKELIEVYPILSESYQENNNWTLISSDIVDRLVNIVELDKGNLIMEPSDTLAFNQSGVPFEQQMDCFGENTPADIQKVSLKSISIGDKKLKVNDEYKQITSSFAPSLVINLTKDEKLSEPSYKDMNSGFELSIGAEQKSGKNISNDIGYEAYTEYDIKCLVKNSSSTSASKQSPGNQKKSVTPKSHRVTSKKMNIKKTDTFHHASIRRTKNGFKRYKIGVQESISQDLNSYFEKLKK